MRTSILVGLAALVACALCYAGAAGVMGSLLARHEKGYRVTDLLGIGCLALIVIATGSAIMFWSGFSIRAFGIEVGGVTWALLGAVSSIVVVRAQDAL